MKTKILTKDRGAYLKMAEGIYQYETSGSYYARFRHKGKRVFERLGTQESPCTSLPEAKRLLRTLKNSLDSTDLTASKKTLEQIIKEFEPIMPGSESTLKYKKRYIASLKKDFPLPQHTKMSDIKKSHILQFMALYKDATPDHYNHVLTLVRDVFNYAVDDKVIPSSPVEGIKYKKRADEVTRLIPAWEDFQAIVKSIRSQVYADTAKQSADLIEFMGLAGLGQAECAALTWGDISFKNSLITLIRKKTRTQFIIPLYPQVRPLLERMESELESKDPRGKVFHVKDAKKALKSACNRLKLPRYSARAFRRMFISRCLHDLGIDVQTIASWQGHKDGGQLILRTYAKSNIKHQAKMAALLIPSEIAA